MTKIFTAIFAAALAVLLITCTAYAEEGSGIASADADLNFEITVEQGFYIRVGSPGTDIDTISLALPAVGDGYGYMFPTKEIEIRGNAVQVVLSADTFTSPLQRSDGVQFSTTGNGWGDIHLQVDAPFAIDTYYDGTADQVLQTWLGVQDLLGTMVHSFSYPLGDARPGGTHIGTITYTVDAW